VDRIVIRLFEYGDAFKLIPIANTIAGTKRLVKLTGSFITTQDSEMQFEFGGTAQDASTMKDYLEPQFRAAKETDLQTSIRLISKVGSRWMEMPRINLSRS